MFPLAPDALPRGAPAATDGARIVLRAHGDRARLELRAGRIVPRRIVGGAREARVALVAGGALLLGGDHVSIEIVVGAGCRLDLEDVAGTVAYGGAGRKSSWTVSVFVEDDASVSWAAKPFIVAAGADVSRNLVLRLGRNASALIQETVVLGRAGESGGRLVNRTRAHCEETPVLVEELLFDGGMPTPGITGRHRVMESLLSLHGGSLARPTAAGGQTTLELERGGSLSRWMGSAVHESAFLADARVLERECDDGSGRSGSEEQR